MSVFEILNWLFGDDLFSLSGSGASTQEDEKDDGGSAGSGDPGEPPA
jgi:hypothetical protein